MENIDEQTGEIIPETLPVQAGDSFLPMKLADVAKAIAYTEDFIKTILKENSDYGIIPGTKKPTLYKSGSEKLAMAFALSPEYRIVEQIEDHDREWEYQGTEWIDNRKRDAIMTTRGWFSYTVECRLVHRGSGVVWATQIGKCESSERGREAAPSNTILKMSQKRAFVGATLNATMTSDRFTCDLDDARPRKSDGLRKMKSKYPGMCASCGNKHIQSGDEILYDGDKKQAHAVSCYNYAKEHPEAKPPETKKPGIRIPLFEDIKRLRKAKDTTGLELPDPGGLSNEELANYRAELEELSDKE